MVIFSQSGNAIFNFDNFVYMAINDYDTNDGQKFDIYFGAVNADTPILGTYSTYEQAIDVMNEIINDLYDIEVDVVEKEGVDKNE